MTTPNQGSATAPAMKAPFHNTGTGSATAGTTQSIRSDRVIRYRRVRSAMSCLWLRPAVVTTATSGRRRSGTCT